MAKKVRVTCDEDGIVYERDLSVWTFAGALRRARAHDDHGHETRIRMFNPDGHLLDSDTNTDE